MVALFGVATLVHFLVVSVARRRREVGVLKSLGFVRRQVALAVTWQATTIAVIGVVIGLPLGIALGHVVWVAFAENLEVFPQLVVNAGVVAVIVLGVVVVVVAAGDRPSPGVRPFSLGHPPQGRVTARVTVARPARRAAGRRRPR